MHNSTSQSFANLVKAMRQSAAITLALTLAVGGFFVLSERAFVASEGDVIINEFVSNPASGNEWVELMNTTESSIDLSGWKLTDLENPADNPSEVDLLSLSGTIPAGGILVFEVGTIKLNNAGDSIGLYESTTLMHRVTYGDVAGPYIADVAAPTAGQSAYLISGQSWATTDTPTKGWFNNAGEEGAAPLLSTVDSSLSDAGINSNIGELDNPSATPSTEAGGALYFEKSGQGKIVFTAGLNLTNQATVAILQSLGEKMEMSEGHIKFDSETASAMVAAGAKIYMYNLGDLGFISTPNLVVKDDEGAVIDPSDEDYPDITGIDYNAEEGTLVFDASHFTQFDVAGSASIEAAVLADVEEFEGEEFTPEMSATITRSVAAYLGRTTDYSGPQTGLGDPETIKWKVTVDGPEALEADMVDLDEVGWVDQTDENIETFHYPFTEQENGNLVALGSCDENTGAAGHDNECAALVGFSLVAGDEFTNADKIQFSTSAPNGVYTVTYQLLDTNDNSVLGSYQAEVELVNTAVTVTADAKSKTYGEADPDLTYQRTAGALIGDDAFTGSLSRESGEDAGTYAITQGTLALASYYNITFVSADFTINFSRTIGLNQAGQWALVSPPTLLSKAPTVTDDEDGAVALLVYENGEFVTPAADNEDMVKPVNAFFIKTTSTGKVGFQYAGITSPTQTAKQLAAGWNLVGTNYGGLAENEFSSIQDTETVAGMVTLYVPDTYNSRKDYGYDGSWEGYINQDLNAKPITNLPDNSLSTYDGYWVYMNGAKAFTKNISPDEEDEDS